MKGTLRSVQIDKNREINKIVVSVKLVFKNALLFLLLCLITDHNLFFKLDSQFFRDISMNERINWNFFYNESDSCFGV